MTMKSRFCLSFKNAITPTFVHRTLKPYQIRQSISFSVEYWQPFIDQRGNSSAVVCGPLLGILIEFANVINSNLTFVSDNIDDILPFEYIKNGSVQVVLTPFAPMSLNNSKMSHLIRFSTVLGDLPMISILSGLKMLSLDLEALSLFNYAFFYLYFTAFFVINLAAFLLISWQDYLKWNVCVNFLRIVLKQPLLPEYPFNMSHLLVMNLFFLTGFFHLFISAKLLAFFTFATPVQKIDTLEQLFDEKDMKIVLFEGEQTVDMFQDEERLPYAKYFKDRLLIENPPNYESGHWEDWVSNEIDHRNMALISDSFYLNHVFNNLALKYPNLYRSTHSQLVLPYFLPLSYQNSRQFNSDLNKMINRLQESGIYEYWIEETVHLNNPTKKYGSYIDPNKLNLDYSKLTLNDISLIFYLILILHLSWFLFFIGEIVHYRMKNNFLWIMFKKRLF